MDYRPHRPFSVCDGPRSQRSSQHLCVRAQTLHHRNQPLSVPSIVLRAPAMNAQHLRNHRCGPCTSRSSNLPRTVQYVSAHRINAGWQQSAPSSSQQLAQKRAKASLVRRPGVGRKNNPATLPALGIHQYAVKSRRLTPARKLLQGSTWCVVLERLTLSERCPDQPRPYEAAAVCAPLVNHG